MGTVKNVNSPASSKKVTLSVVQSLKDAGQDFEFYPTTDGQIQTVTDDIASLLEVHTITPRYSDDIRILDVGAGDGRVLNSVSAMLKSKADLGVDMYAIEKSTIHTDTYRDKAITLIGTEFSEVNFISKSADVAFCNPPYSQFSLWLQTLITQLNFKLLYVVVPIRWKDDALVQEAIASREITSVKVLADSDFLDADRQARAKVQVVRFAFNDFEAEVEEFHHNRKGPQHDLEYMPKIGINATCPFQLFIENELGLKKTYSSTTNKFDEEIEKAKVKTEMIAEDSPLNELVASKGVLWALLDGYEGKLVHTLAEYKKISSLDPALLQELGVSYKSICKGVKEKLLGFRDVYWSLLFDELDVLSSRLISSNRKKLLNTLSLNSLDFTYTNAIYIISYAVDMANELVEESLVEVFKSLTSEDAILRHYKSNEHVFNDDWRYTDNSPNDKSKYTLDYRFISSHTSNFGSGQLTLLAREYVDNILVVFALLGYSDICKNVHYSDIKSGTKLVINGKEPSGKLVDLLTIRFYNNGSRHIKFNQKAMLRFNVTVSRLLGWVRYKADFETEVDSKCPVENEIWEISDTLKVQSSTVLALTNQATSLN